jgi:uncharacterized protein (DUF2236 family)
VTAADVPISRRVNAERIVVLGWSRAILLQLAHPLVAAGVHDHSSFREGRLTAAVRLHHTIRAMLALTFGDKAARHAALEGIRAIHRRVNGTLPRAVGIFPAGARYSAEDPALVLWVHATLLESVPLIYERLVAPLTAAERDAYCDEAAAIAVELGARREEVPRTWTDTQRYLGRMYESGAITVSAEARSLAAAVLDPPFAWMVAPIAAINRTVTVGLLPPAVREQYGFTWTARDERRLQVTEERLSRLHGVLPRPLALWQEAL